MYRKKYKVELDKRATKVYHKYIRKPHERSRTMKYIIDTGLSELMLTPQELEAYRSKLWEEHKQVLYLDAVVHDTMYFCIIDAE